MSDNDDLFEFEDFDDGDLNLDLDDLFGDLATLAIDTEDPGLLDPFTAPVEVAAEPVPLPGAETLPVDVPQPAAQPVAAPLPQAQPAQAAPAVAPAPQPVAAPMLDPVAGQMAGIDPATVQPQPGAPRRGKLGLAIGAAVVVTCANLAAMAIPHLSGAKDDGPQDPTPVVTEGPDQPAPSEADLAQQALLERIAQLEAEVQRVGSPDAAITPSRGDHLRVIDEARSMIARGEHVAARKRLYSLLAIIDRLPSRERDRNEALASYLLADTYKLEARAEAQEAGL